MNDVKTVCLVFFRDHKLCAEDEPDILGILTTRTLAIEAARSKSVHPDDEWIIKAWDLNGCSGPVIWDSYADKSDRYAEDFKQYWPSGFPKRGEQ